MSTETISDHLTLNCAYCNGQITIPPQGDHPTIIHTVPFCQKFDAINDADALVEFVRDARIKQFPQTVE